MRTILVTGSDTGVGKTQVAGAIGAALARAGRRVEIVKVVETGALGGDRGDAARAAAAAGGGAGAVTLFRFRAPLAPAAAAAKEGASFAWESVRAAVGSLPDAAEWRIYEGAGGIATPLDRSHDWADFAREFQVEFTVVVVPDRLGAINQARMAHACADGLQAGIWLNATGPVDADTAASTREALVAFGLPLWGELAFDAPLPHRLPAWLPAAGAAGAGRAAAAVKTLAEPPTPPANAQPGGGADAASAETHHARWAAELADRERRNWRRRLRLFPDATGAAPAPLNLADNDYLVLARDPAVVTGAAEAARRWGASASASPLVTGWREPHEALLRELLAWHRFPHGLLWTSGYAANGAVLSTLPAKGDLVLADRLVHHSMIAGLLRSGARLQRYPHLDLERLEAALVAGDRGRAVFVVTESVFSMDGDHPDLARMAALKREHGFFWIVDEAHGLGWYGAEGSGLAAEAGAAEAVDVVVGTLGKALGSGGAYTLFRDEAARDRVLNHAGEFIYSTALPPPNAGAALAAIRRVRELVSGQSQWRESSRAFRRALRADGWAVPEGDSPIVPVRLGDERAALDLGEALRSRGILCGAIRPPTVPAGTSRLRLSLKRTFGADGAARVLEAMNAGRRGRS